MSSEGTDRTNMRAPSAQSHTRNTQGVSSFGNQILLSSLLFLVFVLRSLLIKKRKKKGTSVSKNR